MERELEHWMGIIPAKNDCLSTERGREIRKTICKECKKGFRNDE